MFKMFGVSYALFYMLYLPLLEKLSISKSYEERKAIVSVMCLLWSDEKQNVVWINGKHPAAGNSLWQ